MGPPKLFAADAGVARAAAAAAAAVLAAVCKNPRRDDDDDDDHAHEVAVRDVRITRRVFLMVLTLQSFEFDFMGSNYRRYR